MKEEGWSMLSFNHEHARVAARLTGSHRDPFDRIICGQSLVEHYTVVTGDTPLANLGAWGQNPLVASLPPHALRRIRPPPDLGVTASALLPAPTSPSTSHVPACVSLDLFYLSSRTLGLRGIADIVEFHRDGTILPVEYKRGQPKTNDCDRIQLCAQALCLEEMR